MSSETENELDSTLNERGKRYGEFSEIARVSQALKLAMSMNTNWDELSDDKREALEMIQHKIARILVGDPDYKDNWHDIQGYAKLAEDRCVFKPVQAPRQQIPEPPEAPEPPELRYIAKPPKKPKPD